MIQRAQLRARQSGVSSCLCISVDEESHAGVIRLANTHDDVWATAGVHPDAADGNLHWIEDALAHDRVAAVGETGLDYFHASEQAVNLPARGIRLSTRSYGKKRAAGHRPYSQAEADTLDLLRAYAASGECCTALHHGPWRSVHLIWVSLFQFQAL